MDFTFRGIAASTKGVKVMSIKEPIIAPIKNKLLTINTQHGAKNLGKQLDPKRYVITYRIENTSPTQAKQRVREIAAWLYSDKDEEFFLYDDPNNKYYASVIDSTDLDESIMDYTGTLTFECADPIAKAGTYETSLVPGTPIAITGTYQTRPIITMTVTTAMTDVKMTHSESGWYIRLIDAFKVGDIIIVDCEKQKITVNGATRMNILDLQSRFFVVKPGNNTITVTPTNKATFKIKYTERNL